MHRISITSWCSAIALAVAACGGSNEAPFGGDGGSSGSTESSGSGCDVNWREATPGNVACPGASGCACGGSEICCVVVPGPSQFEPSCSEMTACADLAFACDGPDDCGQGLVCCAVLAHGGGSSCKPAADCFGGEQVVLCHADADCGEEIGTHCTPAEPGSFFGSTAARCAL